MSKIFESNNPAVSRHLTVSSDQAGLFLAVGGTGIFIDPDKAAEISLAILEAAGVANAEDTDDRGSWEEEHGDQFAVMWLKKYIEHREELAARAAKEAAALEKLTKRRNEVMNELRGDSTGSYDRCTTQFQRAIDRIIDLEDKAQSSGD